MEEDNGAMGAAIFTMATILYFVILGWYLKLAAWILKKGFNLITLKQRNITGTFIIFLSSLQLSLPFYLWYMTYSYKLDDVIPAVMSTYQNWIIGCAIFAVATLAFAKMKRTKRIIAEIQAEEAEV